MIAALPGAVFTATTTEVFAEGLVGSIGVRIEAEDGTIVVARTTIGITESSPGRYTKANLVAPVAGTYIVVWDDAAQASNEVLTVAAIPVVSPLSYATVDEFIEWMRLNGHEWTGTEEEAERELILAERDIDNAAGPRNRSPVNNLKFGAPAGTNEFGLSLEQRDRLSRATCAQAEFRLQMGRAFFIEDQRQTTTTPDGVEQGKVPRLGPLARRELIGSDLIRLTGRLGR
jgi:hypothetical protein